MLSGFASGTRDSEDRPRGVDILVKKPFEIDRLKEVVLEAAELYSQA